MGEELGQYFSLSVSPLPFLLLW